MKKLLKNAWKFEILSKPEDVIFDIANAARVCYQSYKNETHEKDIELVKSLIAKGHLPMLEMADLKVRISNVSRGFTHEMVRHRLCSFAQECVSGETTITGGKIKDLYNYKINNKLEDLTSKNITIKSVNEFGKIINNKVLDVIKKEEETDTYEVTTKLGYKIICTLDHEFFYNTENSKKLRDLKIGDLILVNGTYSYYEFKKEELQKLYETFSAKEISYMLSIPYRSVVRQLKKFDLFISHKNDKEKWKYNKNHTKDSYNKMKETIKQQYKNGRIVWNKGLLESENSSVKNQADSLRENHHNNGSKDKNSNWKNGVSVNYYKKLKLNIDYCEKCGSRDKKLEVHHIDKNRKNNNIENLVKLCTDCHSMIHSKNEWFLSKNIINDEITHISKLDKIPVYDLVMQSPYNNYIANGFMVHNSTRYVDEKDFDIVIPSHVEGLDNTLSLLDLYNDQLHEMYYELKRRGWKPEDARQFLPNGMANEIVVKANIREWRHIFTMRCDYYAHWEIRGLMLDLLKWCKENIPFIFDDFYFFNNGKDYARSTMAKNKLLEEIEHSLLSGRIEEKEILEFVKNMKKDSKIFLKIFGK